MKSSSGGGGGTPHSSSSLMNGSKSGGGGSVNASVSSSSGGGGGGGQAGGGQQNMVMMISVDSPLPPIVQRCLGDRSYEKRKTAALEVEALMKSLMASEGNTELIIRAVIRVLAKDFCTSMNSNYRKGGLIGIAATAIGLTNVHTPLFLEELIPPVLHCFDDPESRVRYYACESLYNIAKVARTSILTFFHPIFDGLTKLFADVDLDVKNGANLLDRLMKDIVTETSDFQVQEFLPLLQTYIRRTNPYIRQLLIGWITVLDSVPDISMIDYLPDFLDGLMHMLSDSNREIRQAADSALSDFLRDIRKSTVIEFGPIVSILVLQCHSPDRLNRLTSISWLAELIHHPYSGGDALLSYHAEILGAVLKCLSDTEIEIRKVAEQTNHDLLTLVYNSDKLCELPPLLDTLTAELMSKEDVPTKMASLRWINMLLDKRRADMEPFVPDLLPVLLRTLSDSSDAVVLTNLQVLSRIALPPKEDKQQQQQQQQHSDTKATAADSTTTTTTTIPTSTTVVSTNRSKSAKFAEIKRAELRKKAFQQKEESQLQMVVCEILKVFAADRKLLETRASLIVRKLCVLLNAKSVYMRLADALASYEQTNNNNNNNNENNNNDNNDNNTTTTTTTTDNTNTKTKKDDAFTLEFIATMVQTLNLILLTAAELHNLRSILSNSFVKKNSSTSTTTTTTMAKQFKQLYVRDSSNSTNEGAKVFAAIFTCWCHNPVATFSLCLLAQAYDLAFCLVKKFSELEVTVGFLMQMDKLVQLLESPIFVHVRLQLLDVEAPYHTQLLKSCYGLLMLLPQSDAFHSLNDRLTTVCNLRDNLNIPPSLTTSPGTTATSTISSVSSAGLHMDTLLNRFDQVIQVHRKAREVETQGMIPHQQQQQQQQQQTLEMRSRWIDTTTTTLNQSRNTATTTNHVAGTTTNAMTYTS